ncbi:unnamed protein product [Blumeria hordei]|uniref:Uncharacterized protein n=1 Tax=Blumeria hordei TaxID=2867405 RepID=A0A383UZF6_BLUHO|nr:unnamed protein product [Blumeria hordei]
MFSLIKLITRLVKYVKCMKPLNNCKNPTSVSPISTRYLS